MSSSGVPPKVSRCNFYQVELRFSAKGSRTDKVKARHLCCQTLLHKPPNTTSSTTDNMETSNECDEKMETDLMLAMIAMLVIVKTRSVSFAECDAESKEGSHEFARKRKAEEAEYAHQFSDYVDERLLGQSAVFTNTPGYDYDLAAPAYMPSLKVDEPSYTAESTIKRKADEVEDDERQLSKRRVWCTTPDYYYSIISPVNTPSLPGDFDREFAF